VQGTAGECDFIEKEIGFNKSMRILDIGCGTGRHSIELTRRGYKVTGIDLSDAQLAEARRKAALLNLGIDFRKMDARELTFSEEFGLAIMICEGSFPLMETDEMNFSILQNAYKSIAKNGKFIFTTLNGLFPLFHSVKDFVNKVRKEGNADYVNNTFDLMTFRDHNITVFEDDEGDRKEIQSNERYYVPSEISWLMKSIGFVNTEIRGAKLGAFSRDDELTTEDFEMLVLAEKK